jgi:hypothetical protein
LEVDETNGMIEILNMTQPVEELGPDINIEVSNSINRLFECQYSKDALDKLKVAYKLPSNCKALGVPKVNQEIWSSLGQRMKQSDYSYQLQHQKLSMVSTILAKSAEKLFTAKEA